MLPKSCVGMPAALPKKDHSYSSAEETRSNAAAFLNRRRRRPVIAGVRLSGRPASWPGQGRRPPTTASSPTSPVCHAASRERRGQEGDASNATTTARSCRWTRGDAYETDAAVQWHNARIIINGGVWRRACRSAAMQPWRVAGTGRKATLGPKRLKAWQV